MEAIETADCIANQESSHNAGIDIRTIAQDKAAQIPVHHYDAVILITAAKHKVGLFPRFQETFLPNYIYFFLLFSE